jgi:hypothetical protein
MSDIDQDAAYRKAKETLGNIGWVFDAYVKIKMAEILDTVVQNTKDREAAYLQAKVAMELKGALVDRVKQYEDTMLIKQKRQEASNGTGTDSSPVH